MSRAAYVHVKLYDAQKYHDTGNGMIGYSVRNDDPQREHKINEARIKQKQRNIEYKKSIKENRPIPPRFWTKQGEITDPDAIKQTVADLARKQHSILENIEEDGKISQTRADNIAKNAIAEHHLLEHNLHPQKVTTFDKQLQMRAPFHLRLDGNTGNTTFILGSSKMGKSTAIMHIYDKYYSEKQFVSILWTANPQIALYKGHKKLIVAGKWNADSEKVIRDEKRIQTKTKNTYKFLNMFDDVINVRNNTLLDNLILTYRNSKMSSIISLQYSNLMSKCSRANCNNILAFGFNTDESIEVVIKTFLTGYLKSIGVPKLPDQINWYKAVTSDHGFIYIKPADGIVSFHRL